jgi:predicted nucleic acid-binding protein
VKISFDTNILVYAQGIHGPIRRTAATALIRRVGAADTVIAVQVLGELFNVLVRKANWKRPDAQAAVVYWRSISSAVATTPDLMVVAVSLAVQNHLFIWDAVILAAAAEAKCNVLLSEDFQDGFVSRGVTVCNPFAPKPHPLIAGLVGPQVPDG